MPAGSRTEPREAPGGIAILAARARVAPARGGALAAAGMLPSEVRAG
jgi:hypothetical protein